MRVPGTATERVEAFSDGVIAIAITLLVLTLKVPESKDGGLFDALVDQWPAFVAFIVSFVVIGIMWVSHHSMFQRIETIDRPLLFLNLLLLMGIAFVPYPTELLAQFVADGGRDSHVAAAMYSTTMLGIGLVFLAMWVQLARRPELLIPGINPDRVRTAIAKSMVGPIVYGLTIGLAFINAAACFFVYAAVAIYFARGPSARAVTPDQPSTPSKVE